MINDNPKRIISIFLFLSFIYILNVAGQNGTNSPYSRYGFGVLTDQAQGFNKGMGGVALGMRSPTFVNFQNPASYSAIDSLTFIADAGISVQNTNLNYGGTKTNARNASLDYLNVGFRLRRGLGFSLGLMPITQIGYSFSTSEYVTNASDLDNVSKTTAYDGDGGLRRAYMGIGWEPLKNISIGLNLSYVWGDYSHAIATTFSETTIHSLKRTYSAEISTYGLDFGLQYQFAPDSRNRFTIGATYGLGHAIGSSASFINQKLSSSTVIGADTIRVSNAFEWPHSFGVGAAWNYKNKVTLGVDYVSQLWGKTKFPQLDESGSTLSYTAVNNSLNNYQKISIGGEYIPNPNSMNYSGQIRYRAGFSYATSYTKVGGSAGPESYCVSLGIGLPIKNTYNNRSILNISAQWEHTGIGRTGLIKENYLRLCVGLTFNEKWFMKWKVE